MGYCLYKCTFNGSVECCYTCKWRESCGNPSCSLYKGSYEDCPNYCKTKEEREIKLLMVLLKNVGR